MCRAEAPHLSRIAKEYADKDLVVLAVNAWDEDKAILRRWARKEDLKQRILLGGNAVYVEYGKPGLPFVVWIKPDGTVHDVELGFDGPEELERSTAALLADSG